MTKTTDWAKQWGYLYKDVPEANNIRYGGAFSYEIAGAYLSGPGAVHDWGCGTMHARGYIFADGYQGFDGADAVERLGGKKVDFRTFNPQPVSKALMRHVLEHNWEWRTILCNFCASFVDRACIVFFIEPGEGPDIDLVQEPEHPPGLQICESDFTKLLTGQNIRWVRRDIVSPDTPPYQHEVIYFLAK